MFSYENRDANGDDAVDVIEAQEVIRGPGTGGEQGTPCHGTIYSRNQNGATGRPGNETKVPDLPTRPGRFLFMKSVGVGYLLWLLMFTGVAGIHRFYAGKWVTGIVWLLTGGLFLIGQLIDLLLIPGMIERANVDRRLRAAGL